MPDPTAADRIRALTLIEAANHLRDAHFQHGMSIQEIGTALRNTADEADPLVGSLAHDGFGPDEIAAMLGAPVPPAPVERADVLREAADAVRDGDLGPRGGMSSDYENGWWNSRAAAEDRVRCLADKPQPVTASDVQHLLTRMRADTASTTLTDLLRLLAVWAASSEGRDVLIDDLITAGYRLPHACGNCDGIDPGTCLTNPDRAAAPLAPVDGAPALLARTESYLSALHGSVARHDNLGENLACAGCELRDQITAELRRTAGEAQQAESPADRCAECGHWRAVHQPGDDPVTPGLCAFCADDDARHDYEPTAEAQQS